MNKGLLGTIAVLLAVIVIGGGVALGVFLWDWADRQSKTKERGNAFKIRTDRKLAEVIGEHPFWSRTLPPDEVLALVAKIEVAAPAVSVRPDGTLGEGVGAVRVARPANGDWLGGLSEALLAGGNGR